MGYKSGQQMHQDEQFCRSFPDLLHLLYKLLLMAFLHSNISILQLLSTENIVQLVI